MTKPEILSVKETAVVQYGMITVKTRVGDLEYSYSTGENGFTQYESGNIDELTEAELIEIDELVDEAWRSI